MANDVEIVVTSKDKVDYTSVKAKTKDLADDAAKQGSKGGKDFGENFTRDARGRLHDSKGRFAAAGADAAEGLVKGTVGVMTGQAGSISKAISNPYVLGAGAALGAIAAIPIGAAISGVAVAGMGAGILGLAAVAVKGSKEVQGAATGMSESWVGAVRRAGIGTEQHFVKALNILSGTADSVQPVLDRLFEKVTPSAAKMASGIDGLVRNSLPGLERMGLASGGVLDRLAAKLPETGDALSSFGDSMAEAADGGGDALVDLLGVINTTVETLGNTLEGASKSYHWLMEDPGWQKWTPPVFLARKMNELMTGNDGTAKAAKGNARAHTELGKAMQEVSDYAADLLASQQELNGQNLSVEKATQRLTRSYAAMAESVKDNGTSLDRLTQKGNENREALTGQIEANMKVFESNVAAGMSVAQATGIYDTNTNALRANAEKLGLNRSQVDELIGAVGRLPDSKNVLIGVPGAIQSKDSVRSVRSEIDRLKGKQVIAKAKGDFAEVRRLQREINNLRNKEVWLTVTTIRRNQSGSANAAEASMRGGVYGGAHGGVVPLRGMASGGAGGGWAMVGENGPELAKLPYGSTVIPHRTTASMMGGQMGGGRTEVVLSAARTGSRDLMALIIEGLRYEVRREGGNVQAVLGTA